MLAGAALVVAGERGSALRLLSASLAGPGVSVAVQAGLRIAVCQGGSCYQQPA
jgi:hypothetical protein